MGPRAIYRPAERACRISGILGSEDGRDDRDPGAASAEHFADVGNVDPADGEYRYVHRLHDLRQLQYVTRRQAGLRRGGIDVAEGHVIYAAFYGLSRLLGTVYGGSEDAVIPE
jgi:hypothetical protein